MSNNHRKYEEGTQKIIEDQGVSFRVANDVMYLRKQPEWNQTLEDGFIADAKTGNIPDVTKVGKSS
jgi:hypothetical protein